MVEGVRGVGVRARASELDRLVHFRMGRGPDLGGGLAGQHLVVRELLLETADRIARLQALEVELDQCWDLLRQRRAKREYGENPDTAQARSADTVEGYLN